MKALKKQYLKVVSDLVKISFKDGRTVENQVTKSIKILKSLPTSLAIPALSEYLKELKRVQRQFTMYVETTFPLSDSQLSKMKKIVEKKHKITKIETKINPDILGGFKLRIGDEIWDESVLEKVNQIKENIKNG